MTPTDPLEAAWAEFESDAPGDWATRRRAFARHRPLIEAATPRPAGVDRETVIRTAAILTCKGHYETEHLNIIPPCASALRDAEWWLAALTVSEEPARE